MNESCAHRLCSVTDVQIIALSEQAAEDGAESEVELCQRALDGHKQSREEVARVMPEHLK
jgi:hypothetical protein